MSKSSDDLISLSHGLPFADYDSLSKVDGDTIIDNTISENSMFKYNINPPLSPNNYNINSYNINNLISPKNKPYLHNRSLSYTVSPNRVEIIKSKKSLDDSDLNLKYYSPKRTRYRPTSLSDPIIPTITTDYVNELELEDLEDEFDHTNKLKSPSNQTIPMSILMASLPPQNLVLSDITILPSPTTETKYNKQQTLIDECTHFIYDKKLGISNTDNITKNIESSINDLFTLSELLEINLVSKHINSIINEICKNLNMKDLNINILIKYIFDGIYTPCFISMHDCCLILIYLLLNQSSKYNGLEVCNILLQYTNDALIWGQFYKVLITNLENLKIIRINNDVSKKNMNILSTTRYLLNLYTIILLRKNEQFKLKRISDNQYLAWLKSFVCFNIGKSSEMWFLTYLLLCLSNPDSKTKLSTLPIMKIISIVHLCLSFFIEVDFNTEIPCSSTILNYTGPKIIESNTPVIIPSRIGSTPIFNNSKPSFPTQEEKTEKTEFWNNIYYQVYDIKSNGSFPSLCNSESGWGSIFTNLFIVISASVTYNANLKEDLVDILNFPEDNLPFSTLYLPDISIEILPTLQENSEFLKSNDICNKLFSSESAWKFNEKRYRQILLEHSVATILSLLKIFGSHSNLGRNSHMYQDFILSLQSRNAIILSMKFFNSSVVSGLLETGLNNLVDGLARCLFTESNRSFNCWDLTNLSAETTWEVTPNSRYLRITTHFLRLLHRLTYRYPLYTHLLVRYKMPTLMRSLIRIQQPEMHAYILRLYKSQMRFLPKKWRNGNMMLISEIWACKSIACEVDDDWLTPCLGPNSNLFHRAVANWNKIIKEQKEKCNQLNCNGLKSWKLKRRNSLEDNADDGLNDAEKEALDAILAQADNEDDVKFFVNSTYDINWFSSYIPINYSMSVN